MSENNAIAEWKPLIEFKRGTRIKWSDGRVYRAKYDIKTGPVQSSQPSELWEKDEILPEEWDGRLSAEAKIIILTSVLQQLVDHMPEVESHIPAYYKTRIFNALYDCDIDSSALKDSDIILTNRWFKERGSK